MRQRPGKVLIPEDADIEDKLAALVVNGYG